ncbi:MAG: carboxylesterase family protein [Oscillospiraceae bacterium]|nr:carboxylesterase family protein [Oscillospiraceae bacterium]
MELVKTNCGAVRGVPKDGYTVFKGIPYAKPPVGALRWRPPERCAPWEGVYEANRFPDRGWQESETAENPPDWKVRLNREYYSDPSYTPPMSEDILYLNIWTPAEEPGEKLPVAFWIHGGGFGSGWSSEMEFDGAGYCRRGVILVTIEYRLGVFGNLVHDWLDAESPRGVSGNYGILDQIAALEWVHENIAAFGGDPENITVFGQSAGAMSCQLLVSTDLTGSLIRRAIFQSGGAHHNVLLDGETRSYALEKGREYVALTGAASLEALRAIPGDELYRLAEKYDRIKQAGILFLPNVDGYVFQEDTTAAMDRDRVKNISYMLGSNRNDLLVTPEMLASGEKSVLYRGAIEWSQLMEERHGNPSYVYYMTHEPAGDDWGAFHGAELWYMFDTMDRCWRPFNESDYRLRDAMMDYWTSFMKTGVPVSGVGGAWRPCTREDPFVKEL